MNKYNDVQHNNYNNFLKSNYVTIVNLLRNPILKACVEPSLTKKGSRTTPNSYK